MYEGRLFPVEKPAKIEEIGLLMAGGILPRPRTSPPSRSSGTMCVPASPASARSTSSGSVISRGLRPARGSRSRRASSAPCSPPRSACPRPDRPCLGEGSTGHPAASSRRPRSRARPAGTAVVISRSSASMQVASSERPGPCRSRLRRPSRSPFSSATTGMPPPPTETTTKPGGDQLTDRVHLDDAERGGARRRRAASRGPRPPPPPSRPRRAAAARPPRHERADRLDGFANAGSAAATATCVTTVAAAGRCRGAGTRSPVL